MAVLMRPSNRTIQRIDTIQTAPRMKTPAKDVGGEGLMSEVMRQYATRIGGQNSDDDEGTNLITICEEFLHGQPADA